MSQNDIVELKFFGYNYYFTQKKDDSVDINELVKYVEGIADTILRQYKELPGHKQIVLTVLSIARDYFLAKNELEGLENRLEQLAKVLS